MSRGTLRANKTNGGWNHKEGSFIDTVFKITHLVLMRVTHLGKITAFLLITIHFRSSFLTLMPTYLLYISLAVPFAAVVPSSVSHLSDPRLTCLSQSLQKNHRLVH
jgi:hypothetical protein